MTYPVSLTTKTRGDSLPVWPLGQRFDQDSALAQHLNDLWTSGIGIVTGCDLEGSSSALQVTVKTGVLMLRGQVGGFLEQAVTLPEAGSVARYDTIVITTSGEAYSIPGPAADTVATLPENHIPAGVVLVDVGQTSVPYTKIYPLRPGR